MADLPDIEILEDGAEIPPLHDVTPGWIARNRPLIEQGRNVTRTLMIVAPPPARVALGAASIVAEAALMVDEYGRRRSNPARGVGEAAALALEGLALAASTRLAPVRLAASLGAIETARGMLGRTVSRLPRV